MGATSSCINDIANDDFAHVLHIQEASDHDSEEDDSDLEENAEKVPMISVTNLLNVPQIRTSVSDNSISYVLDPTSDPADSNKHSFLNVPSANASSSAQNLAEMKSSGSDVSISFFLDRDDAGEAFDENTFANVSANTPSRKRSNNNVTFLLDDQD